MRTTDLDLILDLAFHLTRVIDLELLHLELMDVILLRREMLILRLLRQGFKKLKCCEHSIRKGKINFVGFATFKIRITIKKTKVKKKCHSENGHFAFFTRICLKFPFYNL